MHTNIIPVCVSLSLSLYIYIYIYVYVQYLVARRIAYGQLLYPWPHLPSRAVSGIAHIAAGANGMRAPGPGRAGSPERVSDSGHSPGQQIGLVLKLADDLLKRVKGILVTFEKGDAVIAIPAGVAASEEVPTR